MKLDIGSYQFIENIGPGFDGYHIQFTKLNDWPKGLCLSWTDRVKGAHITLDGGEWIDKLNNITTQANFLEGWPGEAVTDIDGKILCVPIEDGKIILKDTPENLAKVTIALTEAELLDMPKTIYAQIKRESKQNIITINVEVFQFIEVDILIEGFNWQ